MRESSTVRHYRQRADSFYRAVQLLDLDETYGSAVGLLAVHSGIALTDAVLVAEEGLRSKAEDHGVAARALEKLCAARRLDDHGVRHLRELIARKTRFSYGEDEVRGDEFKWAKMKMEQFFKWVYSTFPELARVEEATDAGSS
ncbi:uncharacterized protein CMC5_014730 [Chondromyces crocatus]|uniref:HEPN domain-containing protein n=2 Tax=Chondromyces crocatus TaxID=52 RepID=A0A0K1E8Z1_CHOCO|nr:uncharacterized protein CMC5_014730 [Chondromyces crocatus]